MCHLSALIMVVILCVCDCTAALSGKGYYCRDPDTGKLHAVNSTWTSKSFCGNYTCKIRRKSRTGSEVPIREFAVKANITYNQVKAVEDLNIAKYNNKNSKKEYSKIIPILKNNNSLRNKIYSDKDNELPNNTLPENGDRFLTEKEVKTLSQLLRNMKKSDLEAIVDIYNLAQDVYKEIDKVTVTAKNFVTEMKSTEKSKETESYKRYWYEPLTVNNKADTLKNATPKAMNTNLTITTAPHEDKISYFQGPLVKKDFGALPYYYFPLSSFQRQSSYKHQPHQHIKPCNAQTPIIYPVIPPQTDALSQTYGKSIKEPFIANTQKPIQPSVLLPYPFSYIQRKDMSNYPSGLEYVHNNSPNTKLNERKSKDTPILSNLPDDDNENYLSQKSNIEMFRDEGLLDSLFQHLSEENKPRPKMQTDALSNNVLEEIRAHYEDKSNFKPLSMNKKIKLEKMGKAINVNKMNRDKRNSEDKDLNEEDEFEVFFEQIMCRSQDDPGFYKMGNPSEPYPACCPQRIEDLQSIQTNRSAT